MSKIAWIVAFLFTQSIAHAAEDLVITSFDLPGQITFTKVTNAAQYRVEWSASAGASWTTFLAAASALDGFVVPGDGIATCSVPMLYRVVMTPLPTNMSGMVMIPAGFFMMGSNTNLFPEAESAELPQHRVFISACYMDRYKVTKGLWDDVADWATTNGYDIAAGSAGGKATNHPTSYLSWYECVKWCNARSEKAGLTPCYTVEATTYRTGVYDSVACDWSANGYRLPTEAEWEKAARGGAADHRFPWTDTDDIDFDRANYFSWWSEGAPHFAYDKASSAGYHPAYTNDGIPYTSPVGSFAPNGYVLYDMAGNAQEWVWDWYGTNTYATSPGTDPTGPPSPPGPGLWRVLRSSSWASSANQARSAYRGYATTTWGDSAAGISFRCVRRE